MKRIASVLTIFLALFVAAAAFGLRAEAAGAVYDNAKVLSSADVQKLTAEIQRIEKKHNVRIGIVTQPSMQGRSIGQVANLVNFNGGNAVSVTLTDGAVWNVTGTSLIHALTLSGDSQVIVPEGVTLTVNGAAYTGCTLTAGSF